MWLIVSHIILGYLSGIIIKMFTCKCINKPLAYHTLKDIDKLLHSEPFYLAPVRIIWEWP